MKFEKHSLLRGKKTNCEVCKNKWKTSEKENYLFFKEHEVNRQEQPQDIKRKCVFAIQFF